MKIRYAAVALAMAVSLTACGEAAAQDKKDNKPLSITITDAARTTAAATKKQTVEAPVAGEKLHEITAFVNSYENGELTFTYQGRRISLPFDRENFVEPPHTDKHQSYISEQIIRRRPGKEVKALLRVNDSLSKAASCDVISQNGRLFGTGVDNSDPTRPQEDFDYSMRRLEGSLCEFANPDRALEADLNDLPQRLKGSYPQYVPAVELSGYLFSDGSFILSDLKTEYTESAEGRQFFQPSEHFERLTGFFGTVTDIYRGHASMLLNDGVTICSFPTCFSDGELKEGSVIMAALCCDTALYQSGENRVFDYAVIYTRPQEYGISGDPSSLKYAKPLRDGSGDFAIPE